MGERGVGQRPEVLGRLEFGGVGGQKQQVDVVGDAQMGTGVPAGPVEDEPNLLVRSRPDLRGQLGKFDLKERNADGRGQMEESAA